jgi:hypothetical protein
MNGIIPESLRYTLIMKKPWTALFAVLMAACCASAQNEKTELRHGTILLYEEDLDQVVVVAESKYLVPNNKSGIPSKTDCKIDQLSADTIFFYTGNLTENISLRTKKSLWSQKMFAEEAYRQHKDELRSDERLIALATKYEQIAHPKVDSLIRAMSNSEAKAALGLGGFASLDSLDHPKIALANFTVDVPNDGKSPARLINPKIGEWELYKIGMGAYPPYKFVAEFLGGNTPRAEKARKKFVNEEAKYPEKDKEARFLIAAVNFALDWDKDDPGIGPPVDAVVIEPKTGIRWIEGMKRCRGFNTVAQTPTH